MAAVFNVVVDKSARSSLSVSVLSDVFFLVAPLITQRSDVQNACIPANYRQTNEDGDTKTLDETQAFCGGPFSLSPLHHRRRVSTDA